MKAYPIRTNGEIFEPEVKEERTNKHRKEKEQECNCNRPYEIELTEQEWLQTCTTEQLAELFGHIAKNAYQCGQDGKTNKCVNRKNCTGYCDYGWEVWLKQPHHD